MPGIPMVSNSNGLCRAQLLDNKRVLTAAHCVQSDDDHAFDGDGQAMVSFAGYRSQRAKGIAVDSYGRAVVLGNVWNGTKT
jgi:V8-like Glu-specific endopeptidase